MKKYVLLFGAMLFASTTFAQLISDVQSQTKQSALDWYNCSFEQDSVYGAEVNKAYEFLKGKKAKKKPIVAVIGCGMDVEHEDLRENIWTNPREKDNGKDGDGDGLVGDINGWNFLGGKDGTVLEKTMNEGDREYLRIGEKYRDYITDGENYYKVVDGKKTKVEAPADMDEYRYYRDEVLPESMRLRISSVVSALHFSIASVAGFSTEAVRAAPAPTAVRTKILNILEKPEKQHIDPPLSL